MITQAKPSPYGQIICDPGPCDPLALAHQLREYGTIPILLFIVAAFVAGRTFSRSNYLLPLLCMALIAATMYVHYDYRMKWQAATLNQLHHWNMTANDLRMMEWAKNLLTEFGKRAYLNFALIPFALGLVLNVIRNRPKSTR